MGDEALCWYEHLAENWPFEVAYIPPSLLRRAEIHAERGEFERAIELYGDFVRLWREGDPELRPVVDRALLRVEELGRLVPTG